MNRSIKAQESRILAVARQGQRIGSLRASLRKDKEEDLVLFLEMKNREKERNNLLLQNSEELDAPAVSKHGGPPIFNVASSAPPSKTGIDDFLNSDDEKNDYDWLLTPPGTPLFPSLEMKSQKSIMNQTGTPKPRPTVLKSRLANPQREPSVRNIVASRQPASSPGLNTSTASIGRPLPSVGPCSRSATPTRRRPRMPNPSEPSRAMTPTSRPTMPSSNPTTGRSSTPISRTSTRSSTPTSRTSIPASKPASRADTPTRRSSTLFTVPAKSSPMPTKSTPAASRNPVPTHVASPTFRSRSWKPSQMPGFSLDAPPNLKTSIPERLLSMLRGRPGASSARSVSVEPSPSGRSRRQSCSPSRGRPPNGGFHMSGSSVPPMSQRPPKVNNNVSPVIMGTKMVERVVNMRKLVPPKQVENKLSPHSSTSVKSASSPDGSDFGRTLSKKSLDMAIRHMDIRRTVPNNLRPFLTNIPASSMYSVRSSGLPRSRTVSVSDSPLATSSNASSELSMNNNALCFNGSEVEDDAGSERSGPSPANLHGR